MPITCIPVYRSTRGVSIFPSLPDARIQDIGPITDYSSGTSDKLKITAHIQDGSAIEDIRYRFIWDRLLPPRTLPPNRSSQVSHTRASNIIHYNALPHPRHPPPDPLRAHSNIRIHRRDYIIHTLPLRRPREHLDSIRMVGNHTRTYSTRRKTCLRAQTARTRRFVMLKLSEVIS